MVIVVEYDALYVWTFGVMYNFMVDSWIFVQIWCSVLAHAIACYEYPRKGGASRTSASGGRNTAGNVTGLSRYRYMSLVCINVTQFFFSHVVFFPAVFSAGQQTCLVAWTTSTPLDRFAVRLKKRLEKKLHDRKAFCLHLCKLETCTYISLAAIYGLMAITQILVSGWKYARFLCYSMGAS